MAWPADWATGETITEARLKQWTDAQKTWPGDVAAGGNDLTGAGVVFSDYLYLTDADNWDAIHWGANLKIGRLAANAMRLEASAGFLFVGPLTLTLANIPVYANNAAAVAGGLGVGRLYRTGGDPDAVCIVH